MDKNLYSKTVVKVQKRSGFDKSHQNLFTATVGTLVPILVDELVPNSTVDLEAAISAQLPPLASDTFMRCKLKYASFFVPTRLLVAGYERWLTGSDKANYVEDVAADKRIQMPNIGFDFTPSGTEVISHLAPGSLADYLGAKFKNSTLTSLKQAEQGNVVKLSALPFLAYHRIYDDWFRNSLVQKPVFTSPSLATASDYTTYKFKNSKFVSPTAATKNNVASTSEDCVLNDGVRITDLRQANFDIDLFTSAAPNAENGTPAKVTLNDISGATGSFTISALRSANSMQQFLERNNIAGNRMVDYVRAQYGANLSDAVAQRPILLGSGEFDVYSKGIYQTAPFDGGLVRNPFSSSSAAKFGSASAEGKDKLAKFTTQEPGYLMVLAWLAPHVTYATGVSPYLMRYRKNDSQAEMANPILQNVGNEPIMTSAIQDSMATVNTDNVLFGYGDRYCTWKDKFDECHGLLRDGESLQSFALQRSFSDPLVITRVGTSFLQIPTNYLDQVFALEGVTSGFAYWCDTYFNYKVSMPLARYSVPSLQDPAAEHGEDIVVNRGGTQLT